MLPAEIVGAALSGDEELPVETDVPPPAMAIVVVVLIARGAALPAEEPEAEPGLKEEKEDPPFIVKFAHVIMVLLA